MFIPMECPYRIGFLHSRRVAPLAQSKSPPSGSKSRGHTRETFRTGWRKFDGALRQQKGDSIWALHRAQKILPLRIRTGSHAQRKGRASARPQKPNLTDYESFSLRRSYGEVHEPCGYPAHQDSSYKAPSHPDSRERSGECSLHRNRREP